ncbi:MAG: response regulator [Lachnospiraceae bacterium]|nr:response regulator [Lachnospiraceae bacterium]
MEKNRASRVLIVDDMPINRMILASILASSNVCSDQAESGEECIRLCEKNDYDLILLDHRMPETDGVDTLVRLKEIFRDKGREVPVVCHTTEEGKKNINLYKAAGFADVLIKPVDAMQLSEVLFTYLPEEDKLSARKDAAPANPSEEAGEDEETDVKAELVKLPVWLKTVPHIDLIRGITGCGSAEDYVEALYIFQASADERAEEIERHLESENLTMYRLSVHSLKSMAGLIGARSLHELAVSLEEAANTGDLSKIKRDTPELLATCREFKKLLTPVLEDDIIRRMLEEAARTEEKPVVRPPEDQGKSPILFVQTNQGIVKKGIEKNLRDAGFNVISVPDEPDRIIHHRSHADIGIYYPETEDQSRIALTMNLLGEICQDDPKIFCLTGEPFDLKTAMASAGAHRVSRTYLRPVDIRQFIADMNFFDEAMKEYHRKKTIFVVDDNPDFLSLIERWLKGFFNVSCFRGGDDLISGLDAATPDLILLDYEMPEMDGCELMKSLRTKSATQTIPVIFLTGKNDRDHVFRILEYKPDGYLLKASGKEALLDAIHRFFKETLFQKSLSPVRYPSTSDTAFKSWAFPPALDTTPPG